MTEVVDLSFIDRLPDTAIDRIQQRNKLVADLERENLRRALTHFYEYGDRAVQHAKALARKGQDITDELKDLESTGFGAAMAARLIRNAITEESEQ